VSATDVRPSSEDLSGGLDRRDLIIGLLVIHAAALAVTAMMANASVLFDMTVYEGVASGVLGGGIPYRDVALEYPPLALVPMLLPGFVRDFLPMDRFAAYQSMFLVLMGACSLGIAVIGMRIAKAWGPEPMDPIRPLVRNLLLVVIATPFILWRFDLVPALLTSVAVLFTITGAAALAGVALALAIAVKLYPAVLVPVILAAYLATNDRQGLRNHLVGLVGTGALLLAVTLVVAPEAIDGVAGYHFERGIQIESTFGGLIEIGHQLGLTAASVSDQFNSLQIDASWSATMLAVQPILQVALIALVCVIALITFRREAESEDGLSLQTLINFMVAALLGFMLGSRVLSPQYLVWLLPLAVFLPRTGFILIAIASALTIVIYPFLYGALIALEPLPILLINVRNLVLVVAFVSMLIGSTVLNRAPETERATPVPA
jgi:hypothetical protein